MFFNLTDFFYHFFYSIDSPGDNYFNHLYMKKNLYFSFLFEDIFTQFRILDWWYFFSFHCFKDVALLFSCLHCFWWKKYSVILVLCSSVHYVSFSFVYLQDFPLYHWCWAIWLLGALMQPLFISLGLDTHWLIWGFIVFTKVGKFYHYS